MRDAMLIAHFIGLAMGLGTSFGFMFLGMASSKMGKEEGQNFMLKAMAMSKMGNYGLLLLVISGGYLATPYWSVLGEYPLFATKLVLVVVLGALLGMMSSMAKKARKGDAEKYLNKMKPLGAIAMLTGIAIVVLAVLNFK